MFGSAHCHCRENCATLYKYTAAGVVKGNGTSCQPPDYTFGGAAMSADASAKALKLLADIPEGLYASKETTFGCPDCADQGTYHIEVKKGGVVHAWRIDTQDSSLPDFLKPFQQKIRETMEALK